MKNLMKMLLEMVFFGTLLIVSVYGCMSIITKVHAAEYYTYPLSGHPNYVEPSTFPVANVSLKGSTYLTDITFYTATKLCLNIKDGDVIEIDSGGGLRYGWTSNDAVHER